MEELGQEEPAKKQKVGRLQWPEVPLNPPGGETKDLAALFNQFEDLKKAHEDFENFLGVVLSDLTEKKDHLKRMKDCEKSKRTDKSFASVQLFMITQYYCRINRFKVVAINSLENICKHNTKENSVKSLVNKHIDVLVKMKRRMKNMIDVSDKYAVSDIFDSINIFNELESELEHSPLGPEEAADDYSSMDRRPRRKISRQSKSLYSLNSSTEEDISVPDNASPRTQRLQSLGGALLTSSSQVTSAREPSGRKSESEIGSVRVHPKLRTIRSLTDHLTCLTKSYTNRR